MSKNRTVRESVVTILENIEKNQSYSNLLLNSIIKKNQVDSRDIGLLTELTYGTLQRKRTLDFYLEPFIKNPKKLENWVLQLLRMTLYQMVYLDKIPDRAAIFEAVEIAKSRGHKGISSMVNGVLRSIQRQGLRDFSAISDNVERLAVETSHPTWLVKRWIDQLGYDQAKAMCEINLTAPMQTARVNTSLTTRQACMERLVEEGYQVEESMIVPEAIRCLKGNLANSSCFKDGWLTIQDESSMLVAYAMGVEQNDEVLDACAAPGGKTTHLAEKLQHTGRVVSLDLHEHKVKLIKENAARLQLDNIDSFALDSRKVGEKFEASTFDKILVDAPCSGLGVMRRKPDMKYTKKEADLTRLQEIQIDLLNNVAPLLKPGGVLVYSTCTIDRSENEEVVTKFLESHSEFEVDEALANKMPKSVVPLINHYYVQVLPQDFGSDGFFIASLRKKV